VKVLVTGATGFVAGHLIPALARDHEVFALGHDEARIILADGVQPVVLDLESVTNSALPVVDAIIHLAQANVPFPEGASSLHAVNTGSTVVLLDHARRCNASHFVYASSASVYGLGADLFREDAVPAGRDFYSATKLAAERFVVAYESLFSTTVMRLVAPYGSGQRNRMIPRLIDSVREGRAITLNGGGLPRMNPVYVGDVVALIASTLGRGGNHLVNVAGDDVASIKELGELIGELVGREPVFSDGNAAVAGDIVCANDRMRDVFGLSLTPLRDGLARTIGETPAAE
jgi:nucleoside-diphosphate-sugar epimerase